MTNWGEAAFVVPVKRGVRFKLDTGQVIMLVKVMRGQGQFAYWKRRDRFQVVASFDKRGRYGQPPMGKFLAIFPRIISKPMFRWVSPDD